MTGFLLKRLAQSAHPSIFPFQNFQTADGWIVVACPKPKFWERFCEAIGREDLAHDPRYADFSGRRKHREELQAIIGPIIASKPSSAWIPHFTRAGVPCGPVNSIPEALADPQTGARAMIVEYEQPTLGRVRSIASPVKVGSETPAVRRAPLRNENADEILRDLLRYDDATIARLTDGGAFGEVAVAEAAAVGPLL